MKRIFLLLPVIALLAVSCDNTKKEKEPGTADLAAQVTDQVQPEAKGFDYLPDSLIDPEADAIIYTSFGAMQVKLYDETPRHRDNFLKLAGEGFFDGTLFHRVIAEFMIQGGDPDSKGAKAGMGLGNGGPGYTIPAEFNAKYLHKKGALAAARQGDFANPMKESSGSQFYIVQGKKYSNEELSQVEQNSGRKMDLEVRRMYRTVGGTPFLDLEYTVFGEVIRGLDVIDAIARVGTDGNDRPLNDIPMEVRIVERPAGE